LQPGLYQQERWTASDGCSVECMCGAVMGDAGLHALAGRVHVGCTSRCPAVRCACDNTTLRIREKGSSWAPRWPWQLRNVRLLFSYCCVSAYAPRRSFCPQSCTVCSRALQPSRSLRARCATQLELIGRACHHLASARHRLGSWRHTKPSRWLPPMLPPRTHLRLRWQRQTN
jgi:hypothetical protein